MNSLEQIKLGNKVYKLVRVLAFTMVVLFAGYKYTQLVLDVNTKAYDGYCEAVSEQLIDIHSKIK